MQSRFNLLAHFVIIIAQVDFVHYTYITYHTLVVQCLRG